ncbi:MAG TPA: dihydrodipicolinate synthase family protein, partial [Anaerolineales bacterium]|nr:dihydrodipicolinate synthase family protein [Anaerolineales bacterium]
MHSHPLSGVYAAAVTPLNADQTLDSDGLTALLNFLAEQGCHGALLLGTTGEGTSFSPRERSEVLRAGLAVRQAHAGFRLLAGTGPPSLDETISLTQEAFDLGYDGV